MNESANIDRTIRKHGLVPHPEGGWYRETHRAARHVATPWGPRPAATEILFLLAADQVSRLHRLRQDEVWTFAAGTGLDLHRFCDRAGHTVTRLGAEAAATATVPAGVWMGAEAPGGWALVSCRCVPGFDFADLEFATEAALRGRWPESAAAMARLLP